MKKIMVTLGTFFLLSSVSSAVLIRLDNTGSPGLGDDLDGIGFSDAPVTVAVPEIAGLTLTVHSLGAAGSLNATVISFGINDSSGGDDTDAFDSSLAEVVTVSFNQTVNITQLDFTTFELGDVFNFAGTVITNSDLSNGTTDVFDFAMPLEISANTPFSLQATSGTVGIEALDLTAVPEPSSMTLICLSSLALMLRRRK